VLGLGGDFPGGLGGGLVGGGGRCVGVVARVGRRGGLEELPELGGLEVGVSDVAEEGRVYCPLIW